MKNLFSRCTQCLHYHILNAIAIRDGCHRPARTCTVIPSATSSCNRFGTHSVILRRVCGTPAEAAAVSRRIDLFPSVQESHAPPFFAHAGNSVKSSRVIGQHRKRNIRRSQHRQHRKCNLRTDSRNAYELFGTLPVPLHQKIRTARRCPEKKMKMHKQLCGLPSHSLFSVIFAANKLIPDTRRLDNDSVGINFLLRFLYMCVHILLPAKNVSYLMRNCSTIGPSAFAWQSAAPSASAASSGFGIFCSFKRSLTIVCICSLSA